MSKKFKGKEKLKFDVMQVYDTNADKGKYELMVMNNEEAITSFYVVHTKKYDEKINKYVDDKEYMDNAEQFLADNGVTLDTIKNLEGTQIELYVLETKTGEIRLSPKEFKGFVEYEKTDINTEMYFAENVKFPLQTLPIVDNKNFELFNLGFSVMVDGEEKFYKISTIKKVVLLPDEKYGQEKCSLKYNTEKIKKDYEKKLEVTPNEEAKNLLIKNMEKQCAIIKNNKIATLSEFFGRDIYELIEKETTFKIKDIKFIDWERDGQTGKYIEATLDI